MTSRNRNRQTRSKRPKKEERSGGIRTSRTALDNDKYPARHRLPKLSRAVLQAASSADDTTRIPSGRSNLATPQTAARSSAAHSSHYYEVERVLGASLASGDMMLLIKWEGYSLEECSWEPEEEVDAPELVEEFYSAHGKPSPTARIVLSEIGKRFEEWKQARSAGRALRLE